MDYSSIIDLLYRSSEVKISVSITVMLCVWLRQKHIVRLKNRPLETYKEFQKDGSLKKVKEKYRN